MKTAELLCHKCRCKIDVDRPLTSGDIAKMLHVHLRTVLQWVKDGKLPAYRTPGGHTRVHSNVLADFCKHYGMPVPEGVGA